ncbi:MAG: protein kinase [Acidobacteriota bacterium]
MNLQRLKQIEEVYHAVAELPAAGRRAFYAVDGVIDEELRNDVESLLSFEETSDSFIDTPPDDIAAEMFSAQSDSSRLVGRTIGHYKIRRLLEVGGMGEVYLADDDRLNRKVALKLVWPGLVMQGDQIKRFKREAQASSALNHPNILTIHEFGTEDGTNYIVSEFVDGITLRKRMNDGRISLEESLEIAAQVASALSAAHVAGIVHRDIKPENIMIRHDGIVKLLDFGIAKLALQSSEDPELGNEAQTLFKTAPGIVMGTPNYMSPEQARGKSVDGRTDIWSLGVVIYEMVAGQVPFGGDTQTDVLVSILSRPVPNLEELSTTVPAALVKVIDKALAKNVDERYATAEALYSDLKTFKNRLEFEAELERSQTGDGADIQEPDAKGLSKSTPTAARIASTQPQLIHETNPAPREPASKSWTFLYVILASFAALIAVGAFVWRSGNSETVVGPPPTVASGTAETKPLRTLEYSLTVQSYSDGRYKSPFVLSGEMLFRNRDRIRLNLKSPQTGYLYILNQGPNGENGRPAYNILFPSPTANGGSAFLSAEQEVQIPQQSWFELDTIEGTETVWLVWSAKALPELEAAKKYANAEDRGRIKDPQLSDSINSLLRTTEPDQTNVERDDNKKESRVSANTDIVTHTIKLEHH